MSESWRPLGVETGEAITQYDALREGIPTGMETQFWEWVQAELTWHRQLRNISGTSREFKPDLAEHAAQALSIKMGSVRSSRYTENAQAALHAFRKVDDPLVVADFLLAHNVESKAQQLDEMLRRSRSAWTVGERAGHRGLVRRVPEAVGSQMREVTRTAGSAGAKLSEAWDTIYGITPNATHAYTMAIRAVEDASIPIVVPRQDNATLGHVVGQLRADGDWRLGFTRVPEISTYPLSMCEALCFGQHDRHGGVPSAPGSVSQHEAEAAVSIAVSLVHWFSTGMIARRS